eukprot:TRINITY_DN11516_c0_g1_i1.p1 TRINITY_DN11516_c0_g1~~TRINITY_DN11516_c0_g1_i1.p1  ORF type:complete len:126 (-),score=24.89 TRINITY_DN11516_c0_g1_i1:209-586(-)
MKLEEFTIPLDGIRYLVGQILFLDSAAYVYIGRETMAFNALSLVTKTRFDAMPTILDIIPGPEKGDFVEERIKIMTRFLCKKTGRTILLSLNLDEADFAVERQILDEIVSRCVKDNEAKSSIPKE